MAAVAAIKAETSPGEAEQVRVRAALDRLILDTAHLLDLLDVMDVSALDAVSPVTKRSIRATIAAIAAEQASFAAELVPGSSLAPEQDSAEGLAQSLQASRWALFHAAQRPGAAMDLTALEAAATLAAARVLDFAEACPELLDDPLTLDWILFQGPPGDPSWQARRKAVVELAKARRKAAKKRKPAKPKRKERTE
ncbi:MAG: hypothetical protein ACKVVT_19845 [Dehalococcoidia bacterium]